MDDHKELIEKLRTSSPLPPDCCIDSANAIASLVAERDALNDPCDSRFEELARAQEELRTAEDALRRHGYRKSCDIPACNCGDQWNHGGHAVERLREISDALPYENGKTLLQRVQYLARAQEEIEGLRKDAKLLRHMLFLSHGNDEHLLYGDDGERMCNACLIDFNKDTPEQIRQKWDDYNMQKLIRLGIATPIAGEQK